MESSDTAQAVMCLRGIIRDEKVSKVSTPSTPEQACPAPAYFLPSLGFEPSHLRKPSCPYNPLSCSHGQKAPHAK